MKGFERLHVKSAVKSHSKMRLNCSHLTTLDFGQIVPLYCNELLPGDKFSINSSFFARVSPLVRPTYGDFQFKTASIFVPYHHRLLDDKEQK